MTAVTSHKRQLHGKLTADGAVFVVKKRLRRSSHSVIVKPDEVKKVGKSFVNKADCSGWSDLHFTSNLTALGDHWKFKYHDVELPTRSQSKSLRGGWKDKHRKILPRQKRRDVVSDVRTSQRTPPKVHAQILEHFNGVVDAVEDQMAFVTLISNDGERLIGEYSASELAKIGIYCGRRFTCQTVIENGEVDVRFQAIPDLEVTSESEAMLDRRLEELISGDLLDGDY